MIIRIALRNVLNNLGRRAVLMLVVVGSIALLLVGNAVLEESDRGMRLAYRETFAGDLVIAGPGVDPVNLFGSAVPLVGSELEVPFLPDLVRLQNFVAELPGIQSGMKQLSSMCLYKLDDKQWGGTVFGVDFSRYSEVFPRVRLVEGRYPQPGEDGLVLNLDSLEAFSRQIGRRVKLGDVVTLTVMTASSFSIRQYPVCGIIQCPGQNPGNESLVLADIAAIRNVLDLEQPVASSVLDEDMSVFFGGDIDSLFSDTDSGDDSANANPVVIPETTAIQVHEPTHFLVVRTSAGKDPDAMVAMVKKALKSEGIDVRVLPWREAAGGMATTVVVLQVVFNVGMILVLLVTGMVIMNSVALSILDRTREIGAMRALGAQRWQVAIMVVTELLLIMVFAGILALLAGAGIIALVNSWNIYLTNDLLAALFGARALKIVLSPPVLFTHGGLAILLALFASISPLQIALKIQPVQAIQRD